MNSDRPGSNSWIAGHPVLLVLVSFPIAGFCGALATDIAYAETANIMWSDFSDWLLAAALVMGSIAALVWLVDVLAHRDARLPGLSWPVVIGSALVLVLGLFDNFVHSRDAWTSIVPTGLTLSAIIVVLMLITIALATLAPRRVVPVRYEGARA